ncbi:phytoene desaturase [Roseospirillum parvum]|uniref:Phytoene dehydrogenase n=1 Tax=Roseospirillum parvum TaxID=83401 RepID=A0A1G8AY03_9PROT|nr:phytoene desaturase [Roseospirillum parvum]SDH25724.1 phytoene desaturase [Roseospirillum parvum]
MSASASERPHAIVIGSGFGGLAAAVRLGARGYRVTVLEQLDRPGGRARVFRQDGHVFDAGPTIVTAPFLFEELWELCGRKLADDVTLKPLDPFYRIRFDDGSTFAANADPEFMRQQVAKLSPGDVEGYERFVKESEAVFKVGFQELGDVPFSSLMDMAKAVPGLARHQAWRSVYQHVAACVKDERLRLALSFHPLFIGGNPFSVTSVYSLIAYLERHWGVHWTMGGTGELVRGLVGLIEGQGGTVRLNSEVTEITVDNGRATGVRLADGETLPAKVVVSNADVAWTYGRLVPAAANQRWTKRKLVKSRYSMSLFVWYFGTQGTWPEVDHHSIILGPRYKGLLNDIFHHKVLAEDFSLYLHRPTATDPSMAPEGCDTFYVLSPVPNLAGGEVWDETRTESYRQAVEKRLEETVLPGLKGRVTASKVITPRHFQDNLLSMYGAAFGLEPVFTQSAWFRPHNKSEDVDGLYLVGASTHPGAGLPGVVSSARVLDKVVPDGRNVA